MPSLKTHEAHCIKRFGEPFTEVHKWMDTDVNGIGHRKLHHDYEKTPLEAKELFGDGADLAAQDHIELDVLESAKNKKYPILNIRTSQAVYNLIGDICRQYKIKKSTLINEWIIEFLRSKAPFKLRRAWEEVAEKREPILVKKCEKCGKEYHVSLVPLFINGNTQDLSKTNLVMLCPICLMEYIQFRTIYKLEDSFYEWFLEG